MFRGSYFAYELDVPGQDGPVFAYSQARREVPADGRVGLSWPAAGAIVLRDSPLSQASPASQDAA